MKTILTSKPDSAYDDLNEFRYHFPRTYFNQIQNAVDDWIIYYEPRRLTQQLNKQGGRQAYYATARIARIGRDPNRDDHFYAYMADYLEFDHAVPFKEGAIYYESSLTKDDGSTNKGAFGRSVRNLPDHEYDAILKAGFEIALIGEDQYYRQRITPPSVPHTSDFNVPEPDHLGFSDNEQEQFERPTVERLTKRPFRDEAFRHAVRNAYSETCAMTGLKIINGGGRPEVQAAHIKSVADKGPDSVRNGLALSGTVHWMFDRGLISVDDDYTILTADSHLPPQAKGMLNETGKLILPERMELRPHPQFLDHHREYVFKG